MPNQNYFAENIQQLGEQFSQAIPFNRDYTNLNMLRYYSQEKDDLMKQTPLSSMLEEKLKTVTENLEGTIFWFNNTIYSQNPSELTGWKKYILLRYRESSPPITADINHFIQFLLRYSKNSFPEQYHSSSQNPHYAEKNFPSGRHQQDERNFAHFHPCFTHTQSKQERHAPGGILASDAPQREKNAGNETHEEQIQSFLEMISSWNVQCVVSLGFNSNRLNYANHSSGRFRTEVNTETLGFSLTDTQTGQKKEIQRMQFQVADNAALALSYQKIKHLLSAYEIYKSETILVHCDSGVGRTGQWRLLFDLIDELSRAPQLNKQCDAIIQNMSEDPNNEDTFKQLLSTLYQTMTTSLFRLRKTRYCIQSEQQFVNSLPLFLLIYSIKVLNFNESQVERLRSMMEPPCLTVDVEEEALSDSIFEPPSLNDAFGMLIATPSSASSSHPCSATTRHTPQFPPPRRAMFTKSPQASPRDRQVSFLTSEDEDETSENSHSPST